MLSLLVSAVNIRRILLMLWSWWWNRCKKRSATHAAWLGHPRAAWERNSIFPVATRSLPGLWPQGTDPISTCESWREHGLE